MSRLTRSRADRHWLKMVVHQRGVWMILGFLAAPLACGNVHRLASRDAGDGGAGGAGNGQDAGQGGVPLASAGVAGEPAEAGAGASVGGAGGSGSVVTCEPECAVGSACVDESCVACSQLLLPPLDYRDLPGRASSVAALDFDGDGRTDLAYASDEGVHLELGSSAGLVPQPLIELPHVAHSLRILEHADFDDDGRQDLLLALGDGAMKVLWGSDASPFAETDLAGSSAAVGDFDDDGFLDVAAYTSTETEGELRLLWGRDARGFEEGPSTVVMQGATQLVAADINRDGDLDLTFGRDGALQSFFGDGSGAFSEMTLAPFEQLRGFMLRDLDGNGELDLVMDLAASNGVEIWVTGHVGVHRNYRGILSTGRVTYEAGSATGLHVADVNGDGKLDILANTLRINGADVLLGNGDGTFDKRRSYGTGPTPIALTTGDFNGDGALDLAAVGEGRTLALNRGDGSFGAHAYATLAWPEQIRLADVTGDGHPDALITNDWGNNLLLLPGTPSGELQEPQRITHDPANAVGYSSPILVADFDGDAQPEIGMIRQGELSLFRRTPALRFELWSSTPWSGTITSLSAGDLNEDGKVDVVATEGFGGVVQLRLGTGDGGFGAMKSISVGRWPSDTFLADMSRDGHLDLVVANYSLQTVSVMQGDGAGDLSPSSEVTLEGQPLGIQPGDLNGDGWLDVVATFRGSISVLLGDGAGGLLPEVVYASVTPDDNSGNSGPVAALADFDGDGRLDVATIEDEAVGPIMYAHLVVLHGRGDGSLLEPVRYPVATSPRAVAAADLNGDGKPDAAVLSRFAATLTVFTNSASCGE